MRHPDAQAEDLIIILRIDITIGEISGRGKKTVLVATNGWKLYAFEPDGAVKWESFIYYHPLTKVKILKNPGKTYIAIVQDACTWKLG